MNGRSVTYRSTRAEGGAGISFEEAMLAGLAPDGGLYVPERFPVTQVDWSSVVRPAEAASAALAPYLDMAKESVAALFDEAVDFRLPLKSLGDDLHVLELFHGPTAAFKDVGARVMARLMDAALRGRGETTTVLVATSGDTGGAVADALAGLDSARVAVLFPRGQVSDVQEAQLTAKREGVTAFAVEGTFDDCQRMLKAALVDPDLAGSRLSTANSINIARLLPQALFYLWATAELTRAGGTRAPTFVVPSGNLGNLTAGVYAAEMSGMRAAFLAAHNVNDYFARFLAGEAEPYQFDPSVRTLSNAMDVGGPSNFERLWALHGEALRGVVRGQVVDDDTTVKRIATTWAESGYLACPHTAVGLEAAARARASGRAGPLVVLATASPAKFPDTVTAATGVVPPPHPGLERFLSAEREATPLPPDPAALRDALLAGL